MNLDLAHIHYRRFFEITRDGIVIMDAATGKIADVNPGLIKLLGYARSYFMNKYFWEIRAFADIASNEQAFEKWRQKNFQINADLSLYGKGKRIVNVECFSTTYAIDQRPWFQFMVRDITRQKLLEKEAQERHEKCWSILDNINEYIYSVEYHDGKVTSLYHSPQCQKITGYSPNDYYKDDLLWFKIVHKDDCEMIREFLRDIGSGITRMPIQCRIIRKDGVERWIINSCAAQRNHGGKISRLDGSIIDVTDLDSAAESNAFFANYDVLTKLPNRNLLQNRLEKAVRLSRRENKHLAVLFLDLDNFKTINDTMGHDAGDKVLTTMAKQLNGFVRAGDTVSRWGGDEFVIVLWDCGAEGAALVAEKLTCVGFKVDGIDMPVSMSAGISIFPEDGEDYQTLLKNADMAMYHAKRSGRQNYEFFTPSMSTRMRERFLFEAELRRALEQNEFALFYQPRINMSTGKISGVESLIRWMHPTKGVMLPVDFLPAAEESGLIRRISEWVLQSACRQIRIWQNQIAALPVAVNITPAYFRMHEFEEVLRATLWETGLSPEYLELEFTENTILTNPEKAFDRLAKMKAIGVQLSIDNFGTGYSSFSFLQKMPVNKLKIDGSFVKGLGQKNNGVDLVRSIICVGHNIKASVVAEGVENALQLSVLRTEGCDEGQGYYFCRPVSAETLTALISSQHVFENAEHVPVSFSEKHRNMHTGKKSSLKTKLNGREFPPH